MQWLTSVVMHDAMCSTIAGVLAQMGLPSGHRSNEDLLQWIIDWEVGS
jgi:hypothetical protein